MVDDTNVYDHLKLFARFVRLAGFGGLLVCLDELVNLYKMANTQARTGNYEQILRILNDSLQGIAVGLGFLGGGTPEFLTDTRKGLYSYQALESRLADNRFATGNLVDYSGPVLRLANLTPEDMYVLLGKLRHVFSGGDPSRYMVDDAGLHAFMQHCQKQIGEAYFRTPRNTIKTFLDLLAVLEQNPQAPWQELVGHAYVQSEENTDLLALPEESGISPDPADTTGQDDDLASFKL
jgi:hypothetical protein